MLFLNTTVALVYYLQEYFRMKMGFVSRVIMRGGLAGAILLCIFDFLSSMDGIRMVLPEQNANFLTTFMPIAMALLALACNAGAVYFFKMYEEEGFSSFASTWTFALFAGFFLYDCMSSFVGLVSNYGDLESPTFSGIVVALRKMGDVAIIAIFLLSCLLASGPFLTARLSDVLMKKES